MALDHPTDLILRDVRCFGGEQRGRLRPITLLVGENSTGKTTFLGCYGALLRMLSTFGVLDELLDFNQEPFAMGSFRDIVRSRRGPSGRINEFQIGLALETQRSGLPYDRLTAIFGEEGSQPTIGCLRFQFGSESFLELQRNDDGGASFRVAGRALQKVDASFNQAVAMLPLIMWRVDESDSMHRVTGPPGLKPIFEYLRSIRSPLRDGERRSSSWRDPGLIANLPELIPIAPLRSKPKRTYDPVREAASPEGEHIPMLMMRLNRKEKDHWDSLHDDLVEFGGDAGLFSDIKVRRHGRQMSDPFQLQVKVRSGPYANIVDVGYGISQSLPILVDIMAANDRPSRPNRRERTFLLQQPEVHLHPRGQAQLASLFIQAFKKRGNRFLIETHSDYIVDRVRISVRQGLLKPDDVSILYFEPNGNAVNIHNMGLDDDGNLEGAPPGYREFFLRETDQLLGFAD